MPTSKERINITVDQDLHDLLRHLADKRHLALAAYAKDLIKKALELEEDRYFSAIADERLSKQSSEVSVGHEAAWG